ncbi:MAG: hypothetical protein SF051_07445 [Elusimicrobiota bacterium]|nr:hypothetical protein [Elusimicrobiota bacterium]
MPPVRAAARAGGVAFTAPLRRLLPHKRLPADLTELYGFTGDEDMSARSPRPVLTRGDLAKLRKALNGRADDEACLALALAAVLAGRPYDAVARLKNARDGMSYLVLATALWLHADRTRSRAPLDEAFEAVKKAERLLGPRRDVMLLKAQILLEWERNDEGVAALRAVLRLEPGDWRTRLGLADTLADMKRCQPALAELARVQKQKGLTWWLLAQRGRFKGLCGRPAEALKDFDAALAREKRGGLYAWRAETLRLLGRLDRARADLDEAARRDPGYALAFELRGRLRLVAGDDKGALSDLERACRLDPARRLAFAWRGEALWKLGRAREALADFERVAPLDPGSSWNPATGRMESRADREAAFLAELDAGVRARPGDPWARLTRGFLLLQRGRTERALEDFVAAGSASDARARERARALRERALERLGAAREAA